MMMFSTVHIFIVMEELVSTNPNIGFRGSEFLANIIFSTTLLSNCVTCKNCVMKIRQDNVTREKNMNLNKETYISSCKLKVINYFTLLFVR